MDDIQGKIVMTPLEENILKSEILLKIHVTLQKVKTLSHDTFPTIGPQKLLLLSERILEQIKRRYKSFNFTQMFFIKTGILKLIIELISYIEYSTIKNVTWSIIPAYNRLFKSLLKDTEYIIVPQWGEIYAIRNKNLIDDFLFYLQSPGLIFEVDAPKENINKILEDISAKIYLIKYSRLEKLSALHMALLGHEIGHIFASKWMDEEYSKFVYGTTLSVRLKEIVMEELKKEKLTDGMPMKSLIMMKLNSYNNLIKKNYSELLSDIFGCALFGHTYIVAMYLFSSITDDLDDSNWYKGYLSWRFRLQNCIRFLSFVVKKHNLRLDTYDLYESICSTVKGDIKDLQAHDVCNLLVASFIAKEEEIFETICTYSKSELFVKRIDIQQIETARDRLQHGIIPNAMIKDGDECPIDIRNILFAIWLVSYEKSEDDIQSFSDHIQHYNLLGIKGIELSVEQEEYNDFVKK